MLYVLHTSHNAVHPTYIQGKSKHGIHISSVYKYRSIIKRNNYSFEILPLIFRDPIIEVIYLNHLDIETLLFNITIFFHFQIIKRLYLGLFCMNSIGSTFSMHQEFVVFHRGHNNSEAGTYSRICMNTLLFSLFLPDVIDSRPYRYVTAFLYAKPFAKFVSHAGVLLIEAAKQMKKR